MRRNWQGRYRNNWYRGRGRCKPTNSCAGSSRVASATGSSRAPTNQLPIVVPINATGHNTWKLYFPLEDHPTTTEVTEYIKCFNSFIDKNRNLFDLEKIDQTRSVPLDIQSLTNDEEFIRNWPSFSNDLFEQPDRTLRVLEYCLHEKFKFEAKIKVRVLNHQPVIPIANLKVNYFGKLVTIKGTVIRVGSVGLICTSMAFECSSCHNIQAVFQPQGLFTAPNVCQSCQEGAKFEPLQSSPFTSTMDWQVAKIQEIQSQSISGTIPRSVEIDLQGDLVGTACPGDVLSVTGIVQVRGESKGGEDGKRAARLLQLYIEAVSIHSHRNLSNPTLSFTLKDYYAIQEIHASDDVFRLLVHSLCPAIFGHEAVKAGLILGLVGGTEVDNGPRSNPHVLVVGDPGLGKSQLLQAAAHAAPRGVYVCGASASAGGLTVALGREAGGDFALEAGALVLADRGVCCIDELDKMSAHHSSLLEAMELRRVSVAKGGVVCSLPARATVLAAANPSGGSYNRAKTVAENLKLNSALLSRFDLVFILLDQPDEVMDAMLSEHVLALHTGQKNKALRAAELDGALDTSQSAINEMSLSRRLRLKPGEVVDHLPVVLLRKYIAYARRYVHPKLSKDAANVLQNFYMELRHNHQGGTHDGTPITTRQLEACIRLTQAWCLTTTHLMLSDGVVEDGKAHQAGNGTGSQVRLPEHTVRWLAADKILYLKAHNGKSYLLARARVDLREEATAKDATDVVSLVKHSLIDTFSDEFGNIQLSRSINGSGVSSRSKLKKFLDVLTRRAHQLGKDIFTRQELIQIHKSAGVAGDPNDLIEAMHIHSYLLLKGSNTYQLISL